MNHFSSMGQLLDGVSQLVDDLVAVDCQIYSEYYPNFKTLGQPPIEKPTLSSIIPTRNLKRSNTTSVIPPFLPKQIPLRSSKPRHKALSLPISKSQPLVKALEECLVDGSIQQPEGGRLINNPFVQDATRDIEDSSPSIPLTMYSLFQIPLEASPEPVPALLEESVEGSDDCESSADDESFSSSPPPPFMVFHQAAFKSMESMFINTLSPEFKLHYARDKLTATLDPEKAYFLKYANQLVASRASLLEPSTKLFRPMRSGIVRDLHGICQPINGPDSSWLERKAIESKRFDNYNKGRDTRPNSDGWRILASEFSMIHASKIVRPLKPRAYLPRRSHEFAKTSSPLANCI